MRDANSMLIRLGARVIGAEAGKRGDVEFELIGSNGARVQLTFLGRRPARVPPHETSPWLKSACCRPPQKAHLQLDADAVVPTTWW
jgi:hypothetical protein